MGAQALARLRHRLPRPLQCVTCRHSALDVLKNLRRQCDDVNTRIPVITCSFLCYSTFNCTQVGKIRLLYTASIGFVECATVTSFLRRTVFVLATGLLLDDHIGVCVLGGGQRLYVATDKALTLRCFLPALSTDLTHSHQSLTG